MAAIFSRTYVLTYHDHTIQNGSELSIKTLQDCSLDVNSGLWSFLYNHMCTRFQFSGCQYGCVLKMKHFTSFYEHYHSLIMQGYIFIKPSIQVYLTMSYTLSKFQSNMIIRLEMCRTNSLSVLLNQDIYFLISI